MQKISNAYLQVTSPILFLVFNRPETTSNVFEAIRQVKPKKLYVAADGARVDRIGELDLVERVRAIATDVDWPCEVKVLFQVGNLGCKKAVVAGINWFFENEEQGIILEDDCLPALEFFGFCDRLLDEYKLNTKIGMISGFNPSGAGVISNEYFISENSSVWGWATWADRWSAYDVGMVEWANIEVKGKICKPLNLKAQIYYRTSFDRTYQGLIDTWDYQWTFSLMLRGMKVVKPVANLIANIGTVGAHASSADVNHNISHGKINLAHIYCNLQVGKMQDRHFYDKSLPSTLRLGLQFILHQTGVYDLLKSLIVKLRTIINSR